MGTGDFGITECGFLAHTGRDSWQCLRVFSGHRNTRCFSVCGAVRKHGKRDGLKLEGPQNLETPVKRASFILFSSLQVEDFAS